MVVGMKTKKIPGANNHFYSIHYEKNAMLPVFLFPAFWWESKQQGLEVHLTRFTIGWWNVRLHILTGYLTPPSSLPLTEPVHGMEEFLQWAAHWSKSDNPKMWSKQSFDRWLQRSEWKSLMRWGGTKYHYSRILLAKEYLVSQNQTDDFAEELSLDLDLRTPEDLSYSSNSGNDQ